MGSSRRPRRGESPLRDLADSAASPAVVGLVFREAARRGFTLKSFARAVGRHPRTLKEVAQARAPKLGTIENYTRVLGYAPYVARALCGALTERDIEGIRDLLGADVRLHCENAEYNLLHLDIALNALPARSRNEVLAAYVLAKSGLDVPDEGRWHYSDEEYDITMLPPSLMALDRRLQSCGTSFKLRKSFSAASASAIRGAEANAALEWLCRALHLSDAKRRRIFDLVKDDGPFVAYANPGFQDAVAAAIAAFRAALPDVKRVIGTREMLADELDLQESAKRRKKGK